MPDGGPLIQRHLGLADSGVPCFSVHATCLSFLVALDVAGHFLATRQHRTILIVSSDVTSVLSPPADPGAFVLFGDGAAAVVATVPAPGDESRLDAYVLRTFGSGADLSRIEGWGTARPPHDARVRREDNFFHSDPPGLHALVARHGPETMDMLRPGLSTDLGDVRVVVPHQPSMQAIRSLFEAGLPRERVAVMVDRLGNCGAASMPLTLYEVIRQKRIQRGERMLLMGAGAGLSIGLALVTY